MFNSQIYNLQLGFKHGGKETPFPHFSAGWTLAVFSCVCPSFVGDGIFYFLSGDGMFFFFEKEVNSFKDGVWRFKQQKKPVKLFA